jgi:hypothetical protein
MTRKGTHAHTAPIRWTPEADEALESALIALSAGLGAKTDRWHAVCGRMAPEVITTPQAARSRWDRIVARRAKAAQQVEEANRLEAQIEEETREQEREAEEAEQQRRVREQECAEAEALESILPPQERAPADTIFDKACRIEALLVKLAAVWGVEP